VHLGKSLSLTFSKCVLFPPLSGRLSLNHEPVFERNFQGKLIEGLENKENESFNDSLVFSRREKNTHKITSHLKRHMFDFNNPFLSFSLTTKSHEQATHKKAVTCCAQQ
jgi:hypothetical protein